LVRAGKATRLAAGVPVDVLDSRKRHRKHFQGHYDLKVTETLARSDDFDLVVVPSKPYQLEAALRLVVAELAPTDYLLLT
jgi:hypothetical protein